MVRKEISMKKKETPEEINKRIMEKFRKAPKGMGEVIGRYEKVYNENGEKKAEKKGK